MAISSGMRHLLMLSFLLVPPAACKGEARQSSEASRPDMSGPTVRRMANCPSAVPGAVTKIALTPDGIDVTVTAAAPEAQRRIAALADFHARASGPLSPLPHSGLRGDDSRIGYCPVVHAGATITTAAVPGGVRIQLRADSRTRVKELQDRVSARAARLPGFASS
jgi:hypothetical protein